MPQTNPNPSSEILRKFRDIERRLHALEVTVPTKGDSIYLDDIFDTASTTFVGDGETSVGPIDCFGQPDNGATPGRGTNVLVTGACQIGLDSLTAGGTIGGEIGVQVDGGTDFEPGSGPGIYYLARMQISAPAPGTGIASTVSAARVIQVLTGADTQGLSQHSFAMVFLSTFGQTVHFESRTLAIDPQ
jgi:hypothetical protein